MNLNRDETVEKISAEFDQRLWKTANDDIQLRMFSQYEAEAVRAALSASHEGHDAPCYYCKEPCDSLAGNPGRWPIPLCHRDEPGVVKWHHTGCVAERLIENQPAHSTNSDLLTPERIEEFRREYKIPPFDNNGQPMEDWASEENKVLDALCDAALSSLSAERCRFCGKPYSEPSASPNHPMGCRDDHAPASSALTPEAALTQARAMTTGIYGRLRELLDSYTKPCLDQCHHVHCPLLRDLHKIMADSRTEAVNAANSSERTPMGSGKHVRPIGESEPFSMPAVVESARVIEGTWTQEDPRRVFVEGAPSNSDTERLNWLERMVVEVRAPLRWGSRQLFIANPEEVEGMEDDPSDIRAQIDYQRNGAKTEGGGDSGNR